MRRARADPEWVSWGLGTAPACAGARSQFAGGAGGEAASECLLPHSPWWPPLGLPQLGGPLSPQTLRGSGKGEVCLLDGRPLTTARGGRGGSPGPSVAGRLQGADPGWWLRCRRGRGEGGRGPPAHAPASVWSRLQGDPLLLPSAPSPCHSPLLREIAPALLPETGGHFGGGGLNRNLQGNKKSEMRTVSERRWFVECLCVCVCVSICPSGVHVCVSVFISVCELMCQCV